MNENYEIDKNEKKTTIRIKEQTYNRLSELGTVKETFNEVIEMLLNFYEANNSDLHSSSLEVLKEGVDFPVEDEHKKIALQFFEGVLKLGKDVSFIIQKETKERLLIKNRKNKVKFYKGKKALCLIRTGREKVSLYLPTDRQEAEPPGWEYEWNILTKDALEKYMKVIKRVYEDMQISNDVDMNQR
jgi:predicted CopG family antitoxin